jgi:hypothetical protein
MARLILGSKQNLDGTGPQRGAPAVDPDAAAPLEGP